MLNIEIMAGFTLKEKCESLAKNNPDHDFRVEVCDHTRKPVVQMLEADGSWFCMHEECD
jgi:hypothetical protein